MSDTLLRQIALVSESQRVSLQELAVVSAALQKQVTRDFGPIWEVTATVDVYAELEDVPLDYWPIVVKDNIGFQAAGIHLDKDGQPFALVTASSDNDVWSLTASHECLEMLADPFGNRVVAGDSPKEDQGRVRFLVEVCDPSEAAAFGYSVNGVLVSDFYTPHFFDPVAAAGVRYSFTDALSEPRQVLSGGYLSWQEPDTGSWWQETWFGGNEPVFVELGLLTSAQGSIRSQIDRLTGRGTQAAVAPGRSVAMAAGLPREANRSYGAPRASRLRHEIDELLAEPVDPGHAAGSGGWRRAGRVRQPGPGVQARGARHD